MTYTMKTTPPKAQFFDGNGIRLNYAEGPNNGPPIVLIPAQSATWENYRRVLKDLSPHFHIFALSIRGHGKSTWTPRQYNFDSIGNDLVLFLENVVRRPAVLVGNSSGGLISLWLGVNKPDLVKGIVLEDAPLFSADWPRIQQEFVYEVLSKTAQHLDKNIPDYAGLFNAMERPLPDGSTKRLPKGLSKAMAWLITNRTKLLARIFYAMLPGKIKRLLRDLPTFDPSFSRAWVDGTIYQGLNHEDAMRRIKVPLLILHADWYRTEKGLIGAMDEADAKKAMELAPHAKYLRIHAPHGIHAGKPKEFVRIVTEFAQGL
jgi:pimeloyl-ACP methyl ester carboxylesterase